MRTLFLLALVGLFVGCGSIDHRSLPEQPIGKPLVAGVGDVVLRVNKQRDLENAFGKADLFGRKTNEGFSEVKFAGVEETGHIVLYRKDVKIITNETTMSRTPVSTTSGSINTNATGNYYNNGNYGSGNASATTTYNSTTTEPLSDFHVVVPSGAIPLRLSPDEAMIPVAGFIVEIIDTTQNSITYKIKKGAH